MLFCCWFVVVCITAMTTQYKCWGIQSFSLIKLNWDFELAAVDSSAATQETFIIFQNCVLHQHKNMLINEQIGTKMKKFICILMKHDRTIINRILIPHLFCSIKTIKFWNLQYNQEKIKENWHSLYAVYIVFKKALFSGTISCTMTLMHFNTSGKTIWQPWKAWQRLSKSYDN